MKEYKLFINGKWVPSSTGTLADDLNPATGEVYARIHQASTEDIDAAIAAAYAAKNAWGNTPPAFREGILIKAAAILDERIAEFADVLIDEGGGTFGKAMFETTFVANLLRSAAGECRRIFGETIPSDAPGVLSMTVRRPLGVIAGISPFNFPFLLAMKKVCLALAGTSKALIQPSNKLRKIICHMAIIPDNTKIAKARAWIVDRLCVQIRIRYLLNLSNQTPAKGEIINVGNWLMKPTNPSRKTELVIRYTSQLTAICCIHVPISDMNCPR